MKLLKNLLLVIFVLFLGSSLIKNIFDYRDKLSFYQQYKLAYDQEKQQNVALQTEILKKKDPNELEKTIRNKLNLLKPNEISIILPSPTPTPIIITPTPAPNWQQWIQLFTH